MAKEITSFYGEYEFLNNAYPVDVVYEGQAYPSVEHAYQASKFADKEDRKQFIDGSMSARRAKALGRNAQIGSGWNNLAVMEFLIRQKFYKNEELRESLAETGDADIIMVTKEDKFWGAVKSDAALVQSPQSTVDSVDIWMQDHDFTLTNLTRSGSVTYDITNVGSSRSDTDAASIFSPKYEGKNHMGEILMKIRNEFLMEEGPKKASDIKSIEAEMNQALVHNHPFKDPIVIESVDDIGLLIYDLENEIDRLSNLLHDLYEAEEEISYELEAVANSVDAKTNQSDSEERYGIVI